MIRHIYGDIHEKEIYYCHCCEDWVKVKLNLSWVAAGKPMQWDDEQVQYEDICTCSECGSKFWDPSYGCEECGWDAYPEGGEYYYFDQLSGQIKEIPSVSQHIDNRGFQVVPHPRYEAMVANLGFTIYPIYGQSCTNWDGDSSWDETHFCPHCKEEFSFSNGT